MKKKTSKKFAGNGCLIVEDEAGLRCVAVTNNQAVTMSAPSIISLRHQLI